MSKVKIKTIATIINQKTLVIAVAAMVLGGCSYKKPQVLMKTELGDITVELYQKEAPITAGNFLRYVKEKRMEGAVFYRVVRMDNQPDNKVKIQVIQGGLNADEHVLMLPPIKHETTEQTGILHKDGVISMARVEPGTATSEIFICVGDQPELDFGGRRNPDGQGFAAFGKVIEGMEVVRKIYRQPAEGQMFKPEIKITDMVLLGK
jgi:peptidyl-prolyl cis-trans isomerase A (cyclophilin A)